jgi:hypothetical protein
VSAPMIASRRSESEFIFLSGLMRKFPPPEL